MRTIKSFLLPLCFSILAVIVFYENLKQDAVLQHYRADYSCEISKQELLKGFTFTADTLVSINNLLKAFLINVHLDLITTISTNSKSILVSSHLQNIDQKQAFLDEDNYKRLLQFLNDIQNIPYPLRYSKFCLGTECPGAIEIGVTFK